MQLLSLLVLIVVYFTGKGPLKSYYEGLIRGKRFEKVNIITMWLSSEDYPVLLGNRYNVCMYVTCMMCACTYHISTLLGACAYTIIISTLLGACACSTIGRELLPI